MFEEMVAEIASAFCCACLGITPTVRHADYIGSWLDLCQDNRAIIRAASKAGKAADWLLGFAPVAGDSQTLGIDPDASSRAA